MVRAGGRVAAARLGVGEARRRSCGPCCTPIAVVRVRARRDRHAAIVQDMLAYRLHDGAEDGVRHGGASPQLGGFAVEGGVNAHGMPRRVFDALDPVGFLSAIRGCGSGSSSPRHSSRPRSGCAATASRSDADRYHRNNRYRVRVTPNGMTHAAAEGEPAG